jgi:hypothetical protein
MIHTAKLTEEHITELNVELDTHGYLVEMGYNITTVETHTVVNQKPEKENSGHIVQKIQTTKVPFEQSDIIEDRIFIYTCTCGAYRYHDGVPDLDEHSLTEWSPCKHVERIDPTLKAKQDDDQETLQ